MLLCCFHESLIGRIVEAESIAVLQFDNVVTVTEPAIPIEARYLVRVNGNLSAVAAYKFDECHRTYKLKWAVRRVIGLIRIVRKSIAAA